LYGPGYQLHRGQLHFIFDLIRKIVNGKNTGEPVVLWGDGHQKRELVHVRDFASATLHLSDAVDNDLVNIGAGEEYSIREFAEMICEIVGYDPAEIQYDTSKYVGAKSKCLSVDKLRGLMPDWQPTPLREGLEETVDYFVKTYGKKA
jgi:GDP-L-fucose synthase